MQTPEDIKIIRFSVVGSIRMDMERVQEDPIWTSVTNNMPLNTEDEKKDALLAYFNHYMSKEELMKEVPSTCGPADIYQIRRSVFERRTKQNADAPSNSTPSS